MAYEIQPHLDQYVSGVARTLTAGFDGTDTIVWTGNIAANAGNHDGGVLQFRGTPLSADGNYYVVERISNTSARVQPTPPNNGGVVTGTVAGITGAIATNRIHNALAVTGYPANNRIQATGVGVGVVRLDKVWLQHTSGGSPTTNEGVYVISSVISNDEIEVFGTGITVAAPTANDAVTVWEGRYGLHVIDETAGTTPLAVAGATVFQPNNGAVADYVSEFIPVGGVVANLGREFRFRGIEQVRLRNTDGSTDVVLQASDELWVNEWSGRYTQKVAAEGVPTTAHAAQFGLNTGDNLSGRNGCLLYGIKPFYTLNAGAADGTTVTRVRASAAKWDRTAIVPTQGNMPDGSELLNSLFSGNIVIGPLAGGGSFANALIESSLFDTVGGLVVVGPGLTAANILVRNTSSAQMILATNAAIEGMLLASDGVTPAFAPIVSTGIVILNPRVDYDVTRFVNITAGSSLFKRYTFNPRFVSRSSQGTPGTPIAGLEVRIFDVNETTQVETEIAGSPFTTDALGRLPSPPDLVRQSMDGVAYTDFSQRLLVQGTNRRIINQVVTLTSRFDGDLPVDQLAPDFEGELST